MNTELFVVICANLDSSASCASFLRGTRIDTDEHRTFYCYLCQSVFICVLFLFFGQGHGLAQMNTELFIVICANLCSSVSYSSFLDKDTDWHG